MCCKLPQAASDRQGLLNIELLEFQRLADAVKRREAPEN